jgi:L-ascorbate metabolism protein UlaG (beta-lactamase superfamily)
MAFEYHGLEFEHLGHASLRIETGGGRVVYVDPWTEVYDAAPGDGDVVFVTHDDFDHYDPEAIENVAGPNVTVAVYEAVDTSDLNMDVVSLPYDGETTVDGIQVRTLPAYNEAEGDHVDDEGEPFHAVREVIGLHLDIDGVAVYIPSDTDFLSALESVRADVFVPPIGGHYTMDRHGAAAFARSVEAEVVLPIHYDTFDAIETDAEAFAAELEADGIRVERP